MVFVFRSPDGKIRALSGFPNQGSEEELSDDHPEVVAFRFGPPHRSEQEIETERLNAAMLRFQRVFVELETALSALLHQTIDGQKSQIAYVIYYSLHGFGGRLTMVDVALRQWIAENSPPDDLLVPWRELERHCRNILDIRNTIAHGTVHVLNGKDVRLTAPPFDLRRVSGPMMRGDIPGYTADQVSSGAARLMAAMECVDDFNRYLTERHAGGPALQGKYLALEAHLKTLRSLDPLDQNRPKPQHPP